MDSPKSNPYCSFQDDQSRLDALRSRDQRDMSIARVRAAAVAVIGLGLILSGHADSVTPWLAGLGAYLGIRP